MVGVDAAVDDGDTHAGPVSAAERPFVAEVVERQGRAGQAQHHRVPGPGRTGSVGHSSASTARATSR